MIDRMNERLRFALWVAITEHPSGEADWRDPTGHAVVPPGGSKVAAGTRSGHQYRTPLPGRVPPEEMLAHAGLQDDVSVSTIRALREVDGPDVPEMTGT